MKIRNIYLVFLFVFPFLFLKAQNNNFVSGNLIVMLHLDGDVKKIMDDLHFIEGVNTEFKYERILSKSMNIFLFSFNPLKISDTKMLYAANHNKFVKTAQFNHLFIERIIPNDPSFGLMWELNNTGQNGGDPFADISATEAWDISTGGITSEGDSIVVAVIDAGFDLTHEDLNFWRNYNEIPNNGVDDDNNGYVDDYLGWDGATGDDNFSVSSHGTHVSGTVGAKGNNGIGVTGVNWNVKVMAISYGSSGGNFESNVIASYAFAMDQRRDYNQTNGLKGAFVVATNSSFGINNGQPADYPLWCAMYDSLGAVGILSAGATANANFNIDVTGDIPTSCSSNWLITVTNTTNTDLKNTSAGYGATTIDLGAPGTNITSTYPSNSYAAISGTSMATPHVAGAIALMYSVVCPEFIANYKTDPAGIALMVKDSLLGAVDTIPSMGSGITLTGGRLNLNKAAKAIQNYCSVIAGSANDQVSINNYFEISSVYPNPASNMLYLKYYNEDALVEISLFNMLGQEVKHLIEYNNTKGAKFKEYEISSIDKGIYFLRLQSNNKKSNVVKIILN